MAVAHQDAIFHSPVLLDPVAHFRVPGCALSLIEGGNLTRIAGRPACPIVEVAAIEKRREAGRRRVILLGVCNIGNDADKPNDPKNGLHYVYLY
jgi:hypothetical protein